MLSRLKKYAGVIIGALYALTLRLVFNIDASDGLFSLFSITFIWLTPIVIGLIPLFYASPEQLKNWGFRISSPIITVTAFFLLCFITRIEDLLCILIMLLPYILIAVTAGLIAGEIIQRVKLKKRTLYTILFFPFIASPIEQQFVQPTKEYSVVTTIMIESKSDEVWNNVVRVRQIEEHEYSNGFYNYAGIPRPLYAELDKDTIGATRVGHFEGGLQFIEKVNAWERNKHLGLDIRVVPSSVRPTVFDQHVLKGNHFRFLHANYFIKELPNGHTELMLTSSYQLKTNVNPYASFWGNELLTDFQERLLKVIKIRCEY